MFTRQQVDYEGYKKLRDKCDQLVLNANFEATREFAMKLLLLAQDRMDSLQQEMDDEHTSD